MTRSAFLSLFVMVASVCDASGAGAHQRPVYRVAVGGPVDLPLSDLLSRALESASRVPDAVVVVDIDAAGGRLDIAQLLAGDIVASPVPVYAIVHGQAVGAAALLALSADTVFMVPGSSIGGGEDRDGRIGDLSSAALEAIRGAFGALAARHGAEARVGEAMVDRAVSIDGLVGRDETLTLGPEDAVRLGLAEARVRDLEQLLQRLGAAPDGVVSVGSEWTGTSVEVRNYNVLDARIVLVRGAARYTLGHVTSMGSAQFNVTAAMLPAGSHVRLLAEMIGSSERVTTEEVRVQPGLVLQWVIEQVLSQSNLVHFVRR